MSRGRPSEHVEIKTKWVQEFYDYPSKPELGCKHIWHHNTNISDRGPYKTEITYPKGYKFEKYKPEKGKPYNNQPVVMVFKTSNRTNAKIKMKTWANENIDYIASADKLPGVPDIAVVLELGVGKSFIPKWRSEYNL
tara:strand:+ start:498 stop:908 length:411 start_codon:yes stop_codon:yes gene_type:complete